MEIKRLCKTCGHIYCYTDKDVKDSNVNAVIGGLASLASAMSAVGGTMYSAYENNKIADKELDKVIDYEKCPNCNSLDTEIISDEEFEKIKYQNSLKVNSVNIAVSPHATEESILKRIPLFLEDGDFASANAYVSNLLDINPENANAYFYKMLIENQCKSKDELVKKCIFPKDTAQYKYIKRFADNEFIDFINDIDKEIEVKINNQKYEEAIQIAKAGTINDYESSISKLNEMGDFKDSYKLIEKYNEEIKEIHYKNAMKSMQSNEIVNIQNAIAEFTLIKDYKDSIKKIEECNANILRLENQKKKNNKSIVLLIVALIAICVGIGAVMMVNGKKNLSVLQDKMIGHTYRGHTMSSDRYEVQITIVDENKCNIDITYPYSGQQTAHFNSDNYIYFMDYSIFKGVTFNWLSSEYIPNAKTEFKVYDENGKIYMETNDFANGNSMTLN